MAKLTVSDIRKLYEAIRAENRALPNFDEIDFETKWYMIELLQRNLLGIDGDENAEAGEGWEEQKADILAKIQATKIYDHSGHFVGKPEANDFIYYQIASRRINVPENFSGSVAKVKVPSSSQCVLTIFKNDIPIGALTFETGMTSGVFTSIGAFALVVGDVLSIQNQDPADLTLETVIFSIRGEWND